MNSMILESCPASLLAGKNGKMFNFQHVFVYYSIAHHQNLLKLTDAVDYSIEYAYINSYKVISCVLLTVVVYV